MLLYKIVYILLAFLAKVCYTLIDNVYMISF